MRSIALTTFLLLAFVLPAHADEREICRASQDEQKMVDCVEKGIYDPCDDASPGSHGWITAQCAWAHAAVADRKIDKAEKQIIARLKGTKALKALSEFQKSQRNWKVFSEQYCGFTNLAAEAGVFADDPMLLSYGFCLRRHKEQRAVELEAYLGQK